MISIEERVTIEERITRILLDTFKVRPDSLGPDTTYADLDFDSLSTVEVALILDDEFGISLRDGAITDTMTVTETAELVAGLAGVA
jgi:acyl carrier protein